jgi:hypothetical protein
MLPLLSKDDQDCPLFRARSRTDRARRSRRDSSEDTFGFRERSADWYNIQYH